MHKEKDTLTARKWIIQGKKPKIDSKILRSKDPVDVALLKVYDMCRASAGEVAEFLEGVWRKLN
jgi:hypothetical protein